MAETKVKNMAITGCAYIWAMVGFSLWLRLVIDPLVGSSYHVFVNDVEYCISTWHQEPSPCRPGHHESKVEK